MRGPEYKIGEGAEDDLEQMWREMQEQMQQQQGTQLWGQILQARYLDKCDQLSLAEQHYMAFSTLRRHQQLAQQHLLQHLWPKHLRRTEEHTTENHAPPGSAISSAATVVWRPR